MIEKRIVRVTFLQFLIFLSVGLVFPFFSLYYSHIFTSHGVVNYSIVGTILFFSSIVGIFSPPIAGLLADKFKIKNKLITIFALMSALGSVLLLIPGLGENSVIGRLLGIGYIDYSLKLSIVLTGAMLIGFSTKPIIPLLDTETLMVLELKYNSTDRYGNIRMFGTMGWILSASLSGFIISSTNMMASVFAIVVVVFVVIAVIGNSGVKEEIRKVKLPLKLLFKDREVILFFLYVLIVSIGMNGAFMFTSVYMSKLKVGVTVIGLAFGLAAIPEVVVLINTERLLPLWGYKKMIVVGILIQIVKLMLFAFLGGSPPPLIFILIQSLHGFSFPLQYAAWVSFLNSKAHADLKATYQNFNQLIFTLGGAIGGFLASVAMGSLGARWMMGLAALTVLLSLFVYLSRRFVTS